MLSHIIPQCLVTDRIPIKLQLTGKSRLIFKLTSTKTWFYEIEKNRWRARVTDNRFKIAESLLRNVKRFQESFWLCVRQVEQFFDLRSSVTNSRCFRQHNIQKYSCSDSQSQIS